MNYFEQSNGVVAKALERIKPYISQTPLLQSEILNQKLGNKIYLKADSLQITGSFKIRGVFNFLLSYQEQGKLPAKIVSYSTGNHALAMAYAAKLLNIKARVYLPKNVSIIKSNIAKSYGAEVIEVETRQQAEDYAYRDSLNDYVFLHPSDNDYTIAGAGTLCYEALFEMKKMNISLDYIFGSCGGGGLLSGSFLAKELLAPTTELHGVEPKAANDAFNSLHAESIFRFAQSPDTVADGLRALSVSARTLQYLKKLDGFHLVEEESIRYWTAALIQIMNLPCEPSAAISLAAAYNFLKNKIENKTVLILISGSNIDPSLRSELEKIRI